MTTATVRPVLPASGLGLHAARVAGIVFALIPLAMVVANRSTPLVGGIALVAAGIAVRADGIRLSPPRPFAWPVWAGLTALVCLACWPRSLPAAYGEALISGAVGGGLALVLPAVAPRWTLPALAVTSIAACLLTLIDFETGMAARFALGIRPDLFIYNRPLIVMAMLMWPVLYVLRDGRGVWRGIMIVLPAVLAFTAARSVSGSTVFGLGIGTLAAVFAALLPRIAPAVFAVVVFVVIAIAPVTGDLSAHLFSERFHQRFASSHTGDRVQIWQDFGAVWRQSPWIGQGFGTSPRMGDMPVAQEVPPERRGLLAVGHPHNAVLQVWVELGAVGALVLAVILMRMMWVLARTPQSGRALRYGALATTLSIALVSHGAWQGWWLTAIGLLVAGFRIADTRRESKP